MPEDKLIIHWRDSEIGTLVEWMPDMWYVEGRWVANGTPQSEAFELLAKTFALKQVMADPAKGTRIILSEPGGKFHAHAFVISLTDGLLFIRRVFDEKAVEWLLKEVK